jgi:hypothetical protein
MLTMIKRGLVVFAVLGRAAAAMGQGPSNPPPLIYPFDKIPTDAEIVAALQGSDAHLKELIINRAVQNLPPHSLQDTTVRAISDEILKLRHDVQVRVKADPLTSTLPLKMVRRTRPPRMTHSATKAPAASEKMPLN